MERSLTKIGASNAQIIMKIEVRIESNKKSEEASINYWLTKTSEEKLSALQELREQYIILFNKKKLYNESRKALRRIFKITKLS